MLTSDKNHLTLFQNGITIDKNLPKWKVEKSDKGLSTKYSFTIDGFTIGTYDSYGTPSLPNLSSSKRDKLSKIKSFLKSVRSKSINIKTVPVEEFFKDVKNLSIDQAKYTDRISQFQVMLSRARELGQTALVEKLTQMIAINKFESILYASGNYKLITEEQMVKFAKNCKKGVRLDYIKNFTRPIPDEIHKIKLEADKLKVFDNYVILHYDPSNKNNDLTKKEKDAKKDPILFGIIANSTKLYYIADWVDDYCDLTLEQFTEIIHVNKDTLNIPDKIEI